MLQIPFLAKSHSQFSTYLVLMLSCHCTSLIHHISATLAFSSFPTDKGPADTTPNRIYNLSLGHWGTGFSLSHFSSDGDKKNTIFWHHVNRQFGGLLNIDSTDQRKYMQGFCVYMCFHDKIYYICRH